MKKFDDPVKRSKLRSIAFTYYGKIIDKGNPPINNPKEYFAWLFMCNLSLFRPT